MTIELPKRATLLRICWLAVGCAMISALAFCIRAVYILTLDGGLAGVSRDFLWMSPLNYLIFYGVVTLPVLFLAPVLSAPRLLAIAVFVLVSLGTFDLLLPFSAIAAAASFVLSLGIGSVAARRIGRNPERVTRVVRRVAAVAAVVLAVGAGAMALRGDVWTGGRSPRASATPAQGAPNVLLIIWDTVRAAQLSMYGYTRETTPGLARFASQGVTFDAAMSTAPWTLASHATMFTGRYPQYLSVDKRIRLDGREPTLAEAFRDAGFTTVGDAANLFYASWESGLGRGFSHYQDYRRDLQQLLRSSMFGQTRLFGLLVTARSLGDIRARVRQQRELFFMPKPTRIDERDADDITNSFLRWDAHRPQGKPYFAFLNYIDAHRPYRPPPDLRFRYAKRPTFPDLYDAEITNIDREVTRLLTSLEQKGELRNTLVIITSDHGEHFGERGLDEHANSVYAQTIHVPLLMRFDGHIPVGLRVAPAVSLRDIGATALALAGVAPRTPFPGVSLARYWTAAPDSGSTPIAQLGRDNQETIAVPDSERMEVAVFDNRWHLVRYGTRPMEELFDYRTDSTESRNVIGADAAKGAPERLRALLQQSLEDDRPPSYRRRRERAGKK